MEKDTKVTAWISVADRLPEEGKSVLTYDSTFKMMSVCHIINLNLDKEMPYIWSNQIVTDWGKVTHWKELPEPPYD